MARTKEKLKTRVIEYTYSVLFQKEEDGEYSVIVPALDGSATQGIDLKDARENAKALIRSRIAFLLEIGRPIPKEEEPLADGELITVDVTVS